MIFTFPILLSLVFDSVNAHSPQSGSIHGSHLQDDVEYFSNLNRENIIEGDIRLTPKQYAEHLKNKKRIQRRQKRQITTEYSAWDGNILNYYFDDGISDLKKGLFQDAFAYISSTTCVTFVENKSAPNVVKIVNADACSSYIGMNGGEQELEFGDDCTIFGTAVHELMHALGVYHTHARFDRDNYLNVDYSKAPPDMVSNLEKQTPKTTYNAVPFEYGSTLMYSQNVLGAGSMESKDSAYVRTMGNRRVSFYDMQNINSRYNCKCATNLDCKNQGYTNPSDCSKCVCPSGYEGKLCDQQPSESILLTAKNTWQTYSVNFGFDSSGVNVNFYKAYIWITAPAGKKIEVQLQSMDSFICRNGCNYNGIEIKYNTDPRIVNPIICCNDDNVWNKVYSSKTSPMVMALHQRTGKSKFGFQYRYT